MNRDSVGYVQFNLGKHDLTLVATLVTPLVVARPEGVVAIDAVIAIAVADFAVSVLQSFAVCVSVSVFAIFVVAALVALLDVVILVVVLTTEATGLDRNHSKEGQSNNTAYCSSLNRWTYQNRRDRRVDRSRVHY